MENAFYAGMSERMKNLVPIVVAGIIMIISASAGLLLFPVLCLVKKIIQDLGQNQFRRKTATVHETHGDTHLLTEDPADQAFLEELAKMTDFENLKDIFPKQYKQAQENAKITLAPPAPEIATDQPADNKSQGADNGADKDQDKDAEKDAGEGVPFIPAPVVDYPERKRLIKIDSSKIAVHTCNDIIETMNVLINSNNVYFTIILFLVLTTMIHLSLVCLDTILRSYDYRHMWEAIEAVKVAAKGTEVPVLQIMQEMVKKP